MEQTEKCDSAYKIPVLYNDFAEPFEWETNVEATFMGYSDRAAYKLRDSLTASWPNSAKRLKRIKISFYPFFSIHLKL